MVGPDSVVEENGPNDVIGGLTRETEVKIGDMSGKKCVDVSPEKFSI